MADNAPRIIIKKKKAGHAAHHGGAWKVAYADFVTAMMALFMVLWLLTQADVKLRSEIARYFRDPGVLPGGAVIASAENPAMSRDPQVVERDFLLVPNKRLRKADLAHGRPATPAREGETNSLRDEARARARAATLSGTEQESLEQHAQAIQKAIHKTLEDHPELAALRKQVLVEVADEGLRVQVVDREWAREGLLFDLASAKLKPALALVLGRIARVLGELPNPVHVGGDTDSRPFALGSRRSNWDLSFERADAARRILEAKGLRSRQLSRVLAYADSRPLIASDPLAAANRRISILAVREEPPPGVAPRSGAIRLTGDTVPRRVATRPGAEVLH